MGPQFLAGAIQKTYGIGTVTDYSMIAAVEALGNPVILGILCAGSLAIEMSTAAGWAVTVNTIVARDWMVKLLKWKKADLSGWAFVVVICSLALGLILGLWWKRATRAAMRITAIVMFFLSMFAWIRAHLVLGHHARFFLSDVLFGNPNVLITPHQTWLIPLGFELVG